MVAKKTENKEDKSFLSAIQSELKAPKGQYNKFGKYKYRSCEDIVEAVKPILSKYNAYLTISDEIVACGERIYVKANVSLVCGKDIIQVSAFAREAETKKGMDEAQITGSASSYARKYALNGMFAIDDTKESDSTNKHDKEEKKQPTKKLEFSDTDFKNFKKWSEGKNKEELIAFVLNLSKTRNINKEMKEAIDKFISSL